MSYRIALIAALLACPSVGFAQDDPVYDPSILASCLDGATGEARADCTDAGFSECMAQEAAQSTYGMNTCIAWALDDWDERLNATYQQAMAQARAQGREGALRQRQRDWIAARDATCTQEAEAASGGTLSGVIHGDCLRRETAAQTLVLEREAGLQ
ncbi:MAG: lysozyme inhibitor LprI family protein [Paracoccus sp. (in: a-proteobacteria)]|nr:lysozyme inhibitor LprI family protein [Paracoccus sp. (in: a-proteobacteria)]